MLSLVEEHSADDFHAAEAILGGQKELAQILQMLRDFKRQQGSTDEDQEPVSVERLREIVKDELLKLAHDNADVEKKLRGFLDKSASVRPDSPINDVIEQALRNLDNLHLAPATRAFTIAELLRITSETAGPEHEKRISLILRDLAISAIEENVIVLPTLHSIAQLRTKWAPVPLPYKAQESRRHLAERLFKDVERLAPAKIGGITTHLLSEGLRGPADRAIAETRRKNKKAHGE
ncbi:hypothetical protein BE08_07585 [Sorangium cellulosum]|uniref:Uncharacterized protein n=1 Tax=Sorangium cellulosum TaxID=56 RepID=A0A150PL05_SORCE|nr:hypothetical protein BE08_07585 [Sorangium cellulosum]